MEKRVVDLFQYLHVVFPETCSSASLLLYEVSLIFLALIHEITVSKQSSFLVTSLSPSRCRNMFFPAKYSD